MIYGVVVFELGELDTAVSHLQEALRVRPQNEDGWANYAIRIKSKRSWTTQKSRTQTENIVKYVHDTLCKGKNFPTEIKRVGQKEARIKRLLEELTRDAVGFALSPSHIDQLVKAWGNPVWGAGEEFVRACFLASWEIQGPSLECSSGLTTLIAHVLAGFRGFTNRALKYDHMWFDEVNRVYESVQGKFVMLAFPPLRCMARVLSGTTLPWTECRRSFGYSYAVARPAGCLKTDMECLPLLEGGLPEVGWSCLMMPKGKRPWLQNGIRSLGLSKNERDKKAVI